MDTFTAILLAALAGGFIPKFMEIVWRIYRGYKTQKRSKSVEKLLHEIISGERETPAKKQMEAGLERAQASAQSQAAGMRGVAPGLAKHLAGQQAARTQQNIIGKMGMLRAQENKDAIELLIQLYKQEL